MSDIFSITLPWPQPQLSPNFRTRNIKWIARLRAEYRKSCAEAAWLAGVTPGRVLELVRIIFHPPTKAKHDKSNLVARFKAGQDGLADAMGVNDYEFNHINEEIGSAVKGGAVVVLLKEIPPN